MSYERIVMDAAKARGRRITLWAAECAVRSEKGRLDATRLAQALRKLVAAGRLQPIPGPNVTYEIPKGRR